MVDLKCDSLLRVYDNTTPIFEGSTVFLNPAANSAMPRIKILPNTSNRVLNQRWMEIVM